MRIISRYFKLKYNRMSSSESAVVYDFVLRRSRQYYSRSQKHNKHVENEITRTGYRIQDEKIKFEAQ